MNNTFKYALSVVLGAVMVVPTFAENAAAQAQTSEAAHTASEVFPDVPANHWAYEALENMKKNGVLHGEPDGKYLGKRNLTRYEFAVAVNNAYSKLSSLVGGVKSNLDGVSETVKSWGDVASELKNLKGDLDAANKDFSDLKGAKEDLENLVKLSNEFKSELDKLNVDVPEMQKGLDALTERVTALENKMTVKFSGEANAYVFKQFSMNDKAADKGVNSLGKVAATKEKDSKHENVELMKNFYPAGDFTLNVEGDLNGGPEFKTSLVFQNSDDLFKAGKPFTAGGEKWDSKVKEAYVKQSFDVAGGKVCVRVGRAGFGLTTALIDASETPRWFSMDTARTNTDLYADGVVLGGAYGPAKLGVFAARSNKKETNLAGAKVQLVNFYDRVNVTAGGYLAKADAGDTPNSYAAGVDADVDVWNGVHVNGGFNMSDAKGDGDKDEYKGEDNKYYYGGVSYCNEGWGLKASAGYTRQEKNFNSLGSFDTVGLVSDAKLKGVHGGKGSVEFNWNDMVNLNVCGHYLMSLATDKDAASGDQLAKDGNIIDVAPTLTYKHCDKLSASVSGCYNLLTPGKDANKTTNYFGAAYVDLKPAKNTTWRLGAEYFNKSTDKAEDKDTESSVTPFLSVNWTF